MIAPTVGRIVWFYPTISNKISAADAVRVEQAGQIAAVNDDGTVNLSVLQPDGQQLAAQNVPLAQDDKDIPKDGTMYCAWMPYQVGQAAKTEELQKQTAAK